MQYRIIQENNAYRSERFNTNNNSGWTPLDYDKLTVMDLLDFDKMSKLTYYRSIEEAQLAALKHHHEMGFDKIPELKVVKEFIL